MPFGGKEQPNRIPESTVVRWLDELASPFGTPVLDCRPVTQIMQSTTADPAIAAQFVALRGASDDRYSSAQLGDAIPLRKPFEYPFSGDAAPRGAIFKAGRMEEKWDIYCTGEDALVFARSWTGAVIYAAKAMWPGDRLRVLQISRAVHLDEPDTRSVIAVDYLIKSHLYNLATPHPLIADEDDIEHLALASFGEFGCRALYGTKQDPTHWASVQSALWGEQAG